MHFRTASIFFIILILFITTTYYSNAAFADESVQCPLKEVPFLEEATDRPRSCSAAVHCPLGYGCHNGTVCCGKPGNCPHGLSVATNDSGHSLACSPLSEQWYCPSNAVCLPSTTTSQYLCCEQKITKRKDECSKCEFSVRGSCSDLPCPLNNLYSRIFCCHSSGAGVRRTAALSCADKTRSMEMLPDGRVRQCTLRNPICSTGYSCQASTRAGTMVCCSSAKYAAPYRCPSDKQTPAVSGNSNMFCTKPGQTYVCPVGAICQTAASSPGLHICCYESRKMAQQVSATKPKCPDGRQAQSQTGNSFVPCSRNSGTEECAAGYICEQAINVQNQYLCCSDEAAVLQEQRFCPGQQPVLMVGNEPRYCTPNEPVPCPANYTCTAAINQRDTYVCCSSLKTSACPSDFSPSLNANGEEINCTPNDPSSCPGGAVCLESMVSENTYLCCYSSLPRKICPNDQDAFVLPNGQVELCTGADARCSQSGYTCQVSPELSTWVCCGRPTTMALCANGRETFYLIEGRTYACDPNSHPTGCPANYECTPSNVQDISVCCLISSTTSSSTQTMTTSTTTSARPQCPPRWNPYTNYQTGGNQYCQNVADMSCPTGFSCAQSTQSGIYMCCRFGSSLRCANGLSALLVNNRPRLCSTDTASFCPLGYSCQLSNLANVRICCSSTYALDQQRTLPAFNSDIKCQYDLSPPAIIHNHYIRFCPTLGSFNGCPKGYICSSSNREKLNVCCRSTPRPLVIKVEPEEAVCGENGFAYQEDGKSLECSQDANICPEHYVCQPSFTNTKMYCCLGEMRCPSGVIPASIKKCEVPADCHSDEECQEAENMEGIHICCPATIQEATRCLGRETLLTDANPAACSSAANCPSGYDCSNLTTTNEYACCKEENKEVQICPENRDPYRRFADGALLYCDNTDFACPNGYLCKQSLINDRFICCSPIAFCQHGRRPQLNKKTNQPKRCFSVSDDETVNSADCLEGFTCQQSTVNYIRVCCSSNRNF